MLGGIRGNSSSISKSSCECVCNFQRRKERERRKKRERESGQSWSSVKKLVSVAKRDIAISPDVDESCQREMCFGNSGWKRLRNGGRRKRENEQTRFGKVSWREKKKETDRIKSDFQSSVNIYDFQEANYRAKSVWGWADRETVSCDWDRPHNFEIN